MSAEDFGKYLGRYGKKLVGKDIGQIIDFVKNSQSAGKVTDVSKFVKNSLKNYGSIEKYNEEAEKLAYSVYESKKALNMADNAVENLKIAEELMKAKDLEEAKKILATYNITDAAQIAKLTKDIKFSSLNKLAESMGSLNMT